MKILGSETIELKEESCSFEIDTVQDSELQLMTDRSVHVFIRIRNAGNLKIRAAVPENEKVSIVFWNDSADPIRITEEYEVKENAVLDLAYGECNDADMQRNVEVKLSGRKAKASISSASLVDRKKHYDMCIINQAKDSEAQIRNYAVVLRKGNLMINAIGKIEKGASRSISHQVSRAMSFEEGQKSVILPQLLIDENDVQASHAMSIGRVDEDQLYYMMSRGLSLKDCTSLISLGYLLPITDAIEDEETRITLKNELERKINGICRI